VAGDAWLRRVRAAATRTRLRTRGPRLLAVGPGGALEDLHRELRGLLAHLGVVDVAETVDQLDPLARLEDRVDPAGGLLALPVERTPADVDVVGVVAMATVLSGPRRSSGR
jgi:hypothetical protein